MSAHHIVSCKCDYYSDATISCKGKSAAAYDANSSEAARPVIGLKKKKLNKNM